MRKPKVLIIDDNQTYLDDAINQLSSLDVEVITASSYDAAENLIAPLLSLKATGRWEMPYGEDYKYIVEHEFDFILTDLYMPASKRGVANKDRGEVPYGLVIAMTALSIDIPVAIVTDRGHHGGPILYAMDMLAIEPKLKEKPKFGGKLAHGDGIFIDSTTDDEGSRRRCKNWRKALKMLMEKS